MGFYTEWSLQHPDGFVASVELDRYECREIAAHKMSNPLHNRLNRFFISHMSKMSWDDLVCFRMLLFREDLADLSITGSVYLDNWSHITEHPLYAPLIELLSKQYPSVTYLPSSTVWRGNLVPHNLNGLYLSGDIAVIPCFYWLVLFLRLFQEGASADDLQSLARQQHRTYRDSFINTFVKGNEVHPSEMMGTGNGPLDTFLYPWKVISSMDFSKIERKGWLGA